MFIIAGDREGGLYLFQGCRSKAAQILDEDVTEAVKTGTITKRFTALSREPGAPKVSESKPGQVIPLVRL